MGGNLPLLPAYSSTRKPNSIPKLDKPQTCLKKKKKAMSAGKQTCAHSEFQTCLNYSITHVTYPYLNQLHNEYVPQLKSKSIHKLYQTVLYLHFDLVRVAYVFITLVLCQKG